MRKIALLAIVALLAVACSKEQRQNRKIDGSWNLETVDGQGLPTGDSQTLEFSKDKDGKGEGSYTYSGSNSSITFKYTYAIKGEKITITTTYENNTDNSEFTIVELSRKELILQDSEGDRSIYSKN